MTAEDKLKEVFNRNEFKFADYPYSDTLEAILLAMQEHTRIKCEELLEIVVEKAKAGMNFNFTGNVPYVDKNSILNAVDLDEFIK